MISSLTRVSLPWRPGILVEVSAEDGILDVTSLGAVARKLREGVSVKDNLLIFLYIRQ